jgi:hypothetical protein
MASQTLSANLQSTVAGGTPSTVVGEAPFAGTVTEVTFTPSAAVTGATATQRVLTLQNRGAAGSATTTVATLTYATGTNSAAFDETAFTLSGTPANLVVAEGDVLAVVETVSSTGTINPGGTVRITLERNLA